MDYFEKARVFVMKSFAEKGKPHQMKHFDHTVHWITILKPNADDALLIAAVSHDIERAYRKDDMLENYGKLDYSDDRFIGPHQIRGAQIIADFLKSQGAQALLIERVSHLVSKHEVGGDEDQNILKDADSISFFECNADRFISHKVKQVGKEKVKAKFEWMFNRITTEKARDIARPMYENALKLLAQKS